VKIPSVVRLPGSNNYAVISVGRIVFALDAADSDLKLVFAEEEKEQKELLEKQHIYRDTEMQLKKSASLAIMPTLDCNLKCIYCYARGGDEKKTISFELARKAIESAG